MSRLQDELIVNRFMVMRNRHRSQMNAAQTKWLADQQIKKEMDTRNNIACAVEHMWYLARSVERIEKHLGMPKVHEAPTKSGKKGLP